MTHCAITAHTHTPTTHSNNANTANHQQQHTHTKKVDDYVKACLNRYVLRADLNWGRVLESLRSTGREFHSEGATKPNARPPADFNFHLGTLRSFSREERSVRDGWYVHSELDRYDGRVPSKWRNAKVPILNCQGYSTGSQ